MELPRAAFERRLNAARQQLAERDLPALVVYTDVWRSNCVRHFSNFMPYWNRALLVIPRETPPLLLCGLSPRVYPWIRSVTILEEILPSPNLAQRLLQLCADRGWTRIGAVDFPSFPHDLYTPLKGVAIEDLSLPEAPDEPELAMYRRAAKMAREGLKEEIPQGVGQLDHTFAGRLERRFRRGGAEDLVILLTNGKTPPVPARGETLGESFSLSLALEYRGHWVKVVRNPVEVSGLPTTAYVETLSGSYPFESGAGLIFAARWEIPHDGLRLFHGDTYCRGPEGAELL